MRIPILMLCLVLFPQFILAQRGKSKMETSSRETARELMKAYRFHEAVVQLRNDIQILQRAKKPTQEEEALLKKAENGAAMLEGTAQVVFVDSLVVPRGEFFRHFPLSPECGSLGKLSQLMPKLPRGNMLKDVAAYRNELADRIYFSSPDSTGVPKLCMSERMQHKWTQPAPLAGIAEMEGRQGYPFVMSDGVTLYYAAQTEEGLGGYDIYVTRSQDGNKSFVRPENLGMPFNSPANDYMYVVDETKDIGWFVTDRRQKADSVCIYFFIPSDSREVFNWVNKETEEDARTSRLQESIRQAAMISSIRQTWSDPVQVAEAKERLSKSTSHASTIASDKMTCRYVINDHFVYGKLDQFRSSQAREYAEQWIAAKQSLEAWEKLLDEQRRAYGKGQSRPQEAAMMKLEKDCMQQQKKVEELAKQMRNAEISELYPNK